MHRLSAIYSEEAQVINKIMVSLQVIGIAAMLNGCAAVSPEGVRTQVTSSPSGGVIEFAYHKNLDEWKRDVFPPVGEATPASGAHRSLITRNGWLRVVKEGYEPSQPQRYYGSKSTVFHFDLHPVGYSYVDEVPANAVLWKGTKTGYKDLIEISHNGKKYKFGAVRDSTLSDVPVVIIKESGVWFSKPKSSYGVFYGGFTRRRVELDGLAVTAEKIPASDAYKMVCEDLNAAEQVKGYAEQISDFLSKEIVPSSGSNDSDQSVESRLEKLSSLKDRNLISEQEYKDHKARILNEL